MKGQTHLPFVGKPVKQKSGGDLENVDGYFMHTIIIYVIRINPFLYIYRYILHIYISEVKDTAVDGVLG